jgi:hypothetical protein
VVVRVFRNPATGHYHLFVINKHLSLDADLDDQPNVSEARKWKNWTLVSWKQLRASSLTAQNPLGVPGPEPIQTADVTQGHTQGNPIVVPPISINHIELRNPGQ